MIIPSQEDFQWFLDEFDDWPNLSDSQRWYDIQWFLIDSVDATPAAANNDIEENGRAGWLMKCARYMVNMTDEEFILWKLGVE